MHWRRSATIDHSTGDRNGRYGLVVARDPESSRGHRDSSENDTQNAIGQSFPVTR